MCPFTGCTSLRVSPSSSRTPGATADHAPAHNTTASPPSSAPPASCTPTQRPPSTRSPAIVASRSCTPRAHASARSARAYTRGSRQWSSGKNAALTTSAASAGTRLRAWAPSTNSTRSPRAFCHEARRASAIAEMSSQATLTAALVNRSTSSSTPPAARAASKRLVASAPCRPRASVGPSSSCSSCGPKMPAAALEAF